MRCLIFSGSGGCCTAEEGAATSVSEPAVAPAGAVAAATGAGEGSDMLSCAGAADAGGGRSGVPPSR